MSKIKPNALIKVKLVEANRFMIDCLLAVGTPPEDAKLQSKLLITADRLGHIRYGLNLLEMNVKGILNGACKPKNKPEILKESASTAWVDAHNVLGATSSNFCMDLAIKKAKRTGAGWVAVKGCNHNGQSSFWAEKAAKEGMIGLCFSNTAPVMAPTRSRKAALGMNPLSVVAQAAGGETFFLDVATTSVPVGKLITRRREGKPLPNGWAQGPDGKITNDPDVAIKTLCLMPLGGAEETGGYKGFGLSAMVEIFCGISSGSHYGHYIRTFSKEGDNKPPNLGHCFGAVNIRSFAPGFGERLLDCLNHWRNLEPVTKNKLVLAPGDLEKKNGAITDDTGVIAYPKSLIDSTLALAEKLKVKPMDPVKPTHNMIPNY